MLKSENNNVEVEVIRLLHVIIPTIKVEIVVAPNTNFVRGGIFIRFVMNLDCGLGRVLERRTLNRSYELLTETIGVVGTPKMVFTNLIMTTHMNKIVNRHQ